MSNTNFDATCNVNNSFREKITALTSEMQAMREHHLSEIARVREALREAKRRVENAHKATAAALGSVICVLDDLPDVGDPEEMEPKP